MYSETLKIDILKYARDYGTIAAARYFGVQSSTIVRWNRKYKIYETQTMRIFSVEQKIEILNYANDHGLINAMNHYNVDTATLQKWNKKLKIYRSHGTRHSNTSNKLDTRESTELKIRVLEYARDYGPSAAARTFNVAASTIRLWNNKFKIYQTRKHRTFSDEQKTEIIAYADTHGIANAARKFNLIGSQIQDWINAQPQNKL